MKSVLVDRDLGWNKFKREMKNAKGVNVKIGVLQGAKAYPDGVSQAEVAFFNEFGTRNIPERSFLRATHDARREAYTRAAKRLLSNLPKRGSIRETLAKLGLLAQGDVRKTIRDLKTPPNAPATVKQKGSDNPLVDTGSMLRSIDYEVKA